jgi:hypothetical protein
MWDPFGEPLPYCIIRRAPVGRIQQRQITAAAQGTRVLTLHHLGQNNVQLPLNFKSATNTTCDSELRGSLTHLRDGLRSGTPEAFHRI